MDLLPSNCEVNLVIYVLMSHEVFFNQNYLPLNSP